jgi:hypothetical protein
MTNKICVTALHISSDIFAYHQEHLNCNYSFWFYSYSTMTEDDNDTRE